MFSSCILVQVSSRRTGQRLTHGDRHRPSSPPSDSGKRLCIVIKPIKPCLNASPPAALSNPVSPSSSILNAHLLVCIHNQMIINSSQLAKMLHHSSTAKFLSVM